MPVARLFSMSPRLLAGLLLLLATATAEEKLKPVPATDLSSPEVMYLYAVFYPDPPKADPQATLQALLKEKFPGFSLTTAEKKGTARILPKWEKDASEEMAYLYSLLPHMSHLTDADREKLPATKPVLSLGFIYEAKTAAERYKMLSQANELTSLLAEKTGGLPADLETREIFSLANWQERRLFPADGKAPYVARQIVMHMYRDPQLVRVVTLGMGKLGLPDIAVEELSASSAKPWNSLINVLAQQLSENPTLTKAGQIRLQQDAIRHEQVRAFMESSNFENAKKEVVLQLWQAEPGEGDADNRLIRITATDQPGDSPAMQLGAASSQFWGSKDSITHHKHDEEILRLRDAARAKLPALRTLFQKGLSPGEILLLKAPFQVPGEEDRKEWMWVEVTAWEGEKITGLLMNHPYYIPDLKAGATVEIQMGEVFDYIHKHGDGTSTGNETGKLMQKRQEAQTP